jgi:hypothetical protein
MLVRGQLVVEKLKRSCLGIFHLYANSKKKGLEKFINANLIKYTSLFYSRNIGNPEA